MTFALSVPLALTAFGIIFVTELPDRAAFAALLLATKYRARDVVIGAWAALFVQTVIAVAAGSFLNLLPAFPVRIAAGLGFLAFAVFALMQKEEGLEEEEAAIVRRASEKRPAWLTSFAVIFMAELGDLTQLATAALVAHYGQPFSIGLGSMLALWAVILIAVTAGTQLRKYVKPAILKYVSGVLFAGMGIFIIISAFS